MRPASALQSDPAAWAADEWQEGGEADPLRRQLGRIAGWLGSFAVAAAGSIAPMLNASYVDAFNAAHLSVVLVILLGFSLLRYPRIPVGRELILYVCLLVYMAISAMWTPGST